MILLAIDLQNWIYIGMWMATGYFAWIATWAIYFKRITLEDLFTALLATFIGPLVLILLFGAIVTKGNHHIVIWQKKL